MFIFWQRFTSNCYGDSPHHMARAGGSGLPESTPHANAFDGSETASARAGCTALLGSQGAGCGSAREFSDWDGLSMGDGAIGEAPVHQLGGRTRRECERVDKGLGKQVKRWGWGTLLPLLAGGRRRERTRDAAFIGADRLRTARARRATHGPGAHENARGRSVGACTSQRRTSTAAVASDGESLRCCECGETETVCVMITLSPPPALMLAQIRSLSSLSARDAKVSEPPAERGSHNPMHHTPRGSQLGNIADGLRGTLEQMRQRIRGVCDRIQDRWGVCTTTTDSSFFLLPRLLSSSIKDIFVQRCVGGT